ALGFMLLTVSPPALADDLADCNQGGDRDLRIRGCTRLIERGGTTNAVLAAFYDFRGLAYSDKSEFERARADHSKVIELDRESAVPQYHRGFTYLRKAVTDPTVTGPLRNETLDLAIGDFNKALKLDPSMAIAHYNRAGAYRYKGDLDRAIADYGE